MGCASSTLETEVQAAIFAKRGASPNQGHVVTNSVPNKGDAMMQTANISPLSPDVPPDVMNQLALLSQWNRADVRELMQTANLSPLSPDAHDVPPVVVGVPVDSKRIGS